jgi:UDP-N-acetylglucosamine 3-dehydrogenase
MPQPYGVRGGWRATFTSAVLEYTMRAGYTGQGPATLTEYTADGEQAIELPDTGPPYAAMIGHVLACLTGRASNLIEPASALPALELTLDVQSRLTQPVSYAFSAAG